MSSGKLSGFDFLRAIFSVIVVAVHSNVLVFLTGKLQLTTIADIFNLNVGYLAVPIFFQISLFLFFLKSENEPRYFLKKRLAKLVYLYLFWVILKLVFDAVVLRKTDKLIEEFSSGENFISFVISGGSSAFYFFFSLLFLTALAEGFRLALFRIKSDLSKDRIRYFCLINSCILVFSFPVIVAMTGNHNWLTAIGNPLCFLSFIFTASISQQEFSKGGINLSKKSFKLKLWTLAFLFLVFTLLEWIFYTKFPHYARVSLVFGSWLLLYSALLSTQKVPKLIRFLSGCSLGIYGFHVFILDITPSFESFSEVLPSSDPLIRFAIGLFGSIALTLILRRVKILKIVL